MSDLDTRIDHNSPHGADLSAAGRTREAQILDVLHQAAAARRTRRTVLRRGATVALAITLGALLFRIASPAPRPDRTLANEPTTAPGKISAPIPEKTPTIESPRIVAAPTARSVPVSIITNHDLSMAACDQPIASNGGGGGRGRGDVPSVCLLSDDQLLAALAETGQTYGLVRAAGRVEVIRNAP